MTRLAIPQNGWYATPDLYDLPARYGKVRSQPVSYTEQQGDGLTADTETSDSASRPVRRPGSQDFASAWIDPATRGDTRVKTDSVQRAVRDDTRPNEGGLTRWWRMLFHTEPEDEHPA